MRLAFLGTPEPAAVALRALVEAGHDVAVVVTRTDKRRGRNEAPRPSPVKTAALELGVPISEDVEDATRCGAELGVIVAFGRIIGQPVLDALPMINVHFSLLPRWRGAAPVERAILAGDTVTGVCLMGVDEGLDTGPVYRCAEVAIGPEETAGELRARLAETGAALLVRALREGLGDPVSQTGEPTYASKLTPAELHLDWSRPADELQRVVRVGHAWTTWRGRRLLVLSARAGGERAPDGPPGTLDDGRVATGRGALRLVTVQPEGRQALDAAEWSRGQRPEPGEALGS